MRSLTRLDVRDRVQRLQQDPREESRLQVEWLRQAMTTDLIHLQSLQSELTNAVFTDTHDAEDPHAELFENLDDDVAEAEPAEPNQAAEQTDSEQFAVPPERRPLHLPSSHSSPANHPLCQTELTLRLKQVTRYLADLRDAIAQKSFQYSHVMRSAPSKGVQTRSRTTIKKLSN